MKKKLFLTIATILISVFLMAQQTQLKKWSVDTKYKTMKNPTVKNDVNNKAGMALYLKNCSPCHGKTGLGDGVKSRMLKTFPGDFSKETYQNQSDGEHFYKTNFGRGEMPKYESKILDNDIWNIINYMRSFKK